MQANMNRAAQGAPQGVPAAGGQMASFAQGGIVGYSNGGPTSSRASRKIGGAMDWVKENPGKAAEIASLGLMFIPGVGLANLGRIAAMRGVAKFAPGLASKMSGGVKGLAKKAFTKPYKAKPGQTVYQNPKTKAFESLDPTKRTAKGLGGLPRSFSPTRTAGTVGAAGYLGSKMFADLPEAPQLEDYEKPPSDFGPAYPKTPTTTPAPAVAKKKTGISDEFLATLRGARKGDMTGARMAYKAGQAESELDRLKFQGADYYNQMSTTLTGLNSLRTQQSKLMKEISAIKLTDPIFQAANKAEKAYQEAVEDGDNSKIIAAKQEVAIQNKNAMERWAAKYPAEAAALQKLSASIAEGEARQQSIGKNWYGDSPNSTNSDFKVKKIN